jgi:hypothetical protein
MPTFTSSQVASGRAHKPLIGDPGVCSAYGEINVTANPAPSDIYELVRLPAGATVIGGYFYIDDLDTGTETLDIDLGWAGNGAEALDADGFGNNGVLDGDAVAGIKPEVGSWRPLGGVLFTTGPQTFTRETIIQATCVATAATFAAGKMWVKIDYVVS